MVHKGPGKANREGISLTKLIRMFPDDDAARIWFEKQIWATGPHCPHCGSLNVQCDIKHKTMTHRCRDCDGRPMFSLKTGNIMEGSKLGYQTWAIAIYLVTTSLKGVSSMKLHRDLEITQKSAWHLAHRLRKAFEAGTPMFAGPVEADECYVGGKRENMPKAKRKTLKGRGPVGKAIVAGAKDRATGQISAKVVASADKKTLHQFLKDRAAPDAKVYTDDYVIYRDLPFDHEAVQHLTGEYVRGDAHTNGIESFWSMLKRAHKGTFHHLSAKHLDRYVTEFAGKHNIRNADTVDQMAIIAKDMVGRRLRYRELVG